VQVVLTQLKALGCGAPNAARCRFLVQSDADEGIERISRAKRPAELKNEGIEVFWCGTAVTTLSQGPRGAQSNALIEWWRASFSDPSIVSFAPYCPGQSQTDPAQ
jgi:hypothetical protein